MEANDSNGFEFLDILSIISFAMQMQNYYELKAQATTDDIFKELQKQDREYLDRIIQNQEKILERLTALDG